MKMAKHGYWNIGAEIIIIMEYDYEIVFSFWACERDEYDCRNNLV